MELLHNLGGLLKYQPENRIIISIKRENFAKFLRKFDENKLFKPTWLDRLICMELILISKKIVGVAKFSHKTIEEAEKLSCATIFETLKESFNFTLLYCLLNQSIITCISRTSNIQS